MSSRTVARPPVPVSDPQQRRRVLRTSVEDQPADLYSGDVGGAHGHLAVVGDEGGEAKPEHDRVRALDVDRLVEVVDAGSEDEVAPMGQFLVDMAPPPAPPRARAQARGAPAARRGAGA